MPDNWWFTSKLAEGRMADLDRLIDRLQKEEQLQGVRRPRKARMRAGAGRVASRAGAAIGRALTRLAAHVRDLLHGRHWPHHHHPIGHAT
ncbi:MAG TPA: hypothetical protein VLH81_02825 [Desulfobacterales bacterium]|nr:hypothetical protein [Desulfobacterales bacterium]